MYDLEESKLDIEIVDRRAAGGMMVYHVRKPTEKERFTYRGNAFIRKGKKVINRTHLQRKEYAQKVLVGFEKNSNIGTSGMPLSSDPDDPGYRSNWRELLAKGLPEHMDIIAQTVFEPAREKVDVDPDLEFEVAEDEEQDDAPGDDGEVETIEDPLGS